MKSAAASRRAWNEFCRDLASGSDCLLAFDFDGTLAPIAARPGLAAMDSNIRRVLLRLIGLPGVHIAILSGRGLMDLMRRVRVPGAIYFSNHGLDSSSWQLAPPLPRRQAWKRLAAKGKQRLQSVMVRYPGARLEDKGLDLTLHYRGLPPSRARRLLAEAESALAGLPLRFVTGKQALELRPRSIEHKGRALLKACRALGRPSLVFFAGDDRTDEDAFRSLRALGRGSLGMKIGPGPTLADLRISRHHLLARLREIYQMRKFGGIR